MNINMLNPETVGDKSIEQKAAERRQKLKMNVQIEVMKQLGFFDTPAYKKAETPEEKMYAENDIFMSWINSGTTNLFRECFDELVPPGTDRSDEELPQLVTAILAEMRIRSRH